jgi:hypothetical protein
MPLSASDAMPVGSLGCGMGKVAVILLVAGGLVVLVGLLRIRYERRGDESLHALIFL